MGTNNKQRRAAKQRKRGRERSSRQGEREFGRSWFDWATDQGPDWGPGPDEDEDALAVVEHLLNRTVRRLADKRPDEVELRRSAEALVRSLAPIPRVYLASALQLLLDGLVDSAVVGGWAPADLAELVRRHAGPRHLPGLASLLHACARRQGRRDGAWTTQLEVLGAPVAFEFESIDGIATGLQLAARLGAIPVLEPSAAASPSGASGAAHPKLAQVRALLAKAESTTHPEEAEALAAKAQELISRYALDRLLAQGRAQSGGPRAGSRAMDGDHGRRVTSRRIWLDAPYLLAKASLVHEVASANRCRAVFTERLGFCLVVGHESDIASVELLTTSLLVQADAAMLREGRRVDSGGRSRTRAFRQSFLVAYAGRIGKRLRAVNDGVVSTEASLLPVVRDHESRVADALAALVPGIVERVTSVTDREGWAAGQVAADLALLDVHGRIAEASSA